MVGKAQTSGKGSISGKGSYIGSYKLGAQYVSVSEFTWKSRQAPSELVRWD